MQRNKCGMRNAKCGVIRHSQVQNPNSKLRNCRAFTLTELLIVISIVGIMAGLSLSALAGAIEMAREQRTRSIITKIDQLIMERYEGYRTRAVPLRISASLIASQGKAFGPQMRLYALRDLMRMELPDRVTDVTDIPATLSTGVSLPQPSLWKAYRRAAQRACGTNWATVWTEQNQGSECLFLILSSMMDGDKNALDFFSSDEIGDTDGDGMKEILDGWGNPIEFLRWAPGYLPPLALTTQSTAVPDPFDPLHVDPRFNPNALQKPYLLRPLIFSSGRDKQQDIAAQASSSSGSGQFRYSTTLPPSDPYYGLNTSGQTLLGTPVDFGNDGDGSRDNITNHYIATP